jgi:hypothetical protein
MPFIIGIEGGYGAGKTLTSAIKGHQWKLATGAEIFANYALREAYLFEHYTDWYRVAHIHGTIIIFDESQKDWDSRRFAGASQVDKTHIMNYVRKMNSVFVFVLPDFSDVDARVRKMCEILIHVERKRDGTMENRIYDYTDKRYGENGRLIKREYLSWAKQKEVFKLNLYNTSQMVMSFPMPGPDQTQEFFRRLDEIHNAAVKREYPDRPDIQIKLKSELEIDELYNPYHFEEMMEDAKRDETNAKSVFIPSSDQGKKARKKPGGNSQLVLI